MEQQSIIVKKVKKGGHGHHGGSWKVALADFMTAMMAFFLLLWLLATATEDQLRGISEYFKNVGLGHGGNDGLEHNTMIIGPGGASTSVIDLRGTSMDMISGKIEYAEDPPNASKREEIEQKDEDAERLDMERLEELEGELIQAIERDQTLQPFKEQIKLDVTTEGLRIQIVDKKNRPMFDSASEVLKSYTAKILYRIGKVINKVPNDIVISGHTDSARFYADIEDYSNWELSADRANATRRALIKGGMSPKKVAKVIGVADSDPFNKKDPMHYSNRRITIVVLSKTAKRNAANLAKKTKTPSKAPFKNLPQETREQIRLDKAPGLPPPSQKSSPIQR